MVRNGIHHLVDQVVNNKVRTEFKDKIEKSLKDYLGIKDPEEPAVKSDDSPSKPCENENDANDDQKEEDKNIDNVIDSQAEPLLVKKGRMEQISEDEDFDRMSIDSSSSSDNKSLPSSPKPEMPSPEHQSLSFQENLEINVSPEVHSESQASTSELCAKQDDDSNLEIANVSQVDSTFTSTPQHFVEESVDTNIDSQSPSKDDNDQLITVANTTQSETFVDSTENNSNFVEEETFTKTEVKEQEDISDISSVHTSDLSDFDDEISISSDDDHKDSKKKKISLKVVKELTASISEERNSIDIDVSSEQALSRKSTASSDTDDDQNEKLKRKRKKNINIESSEPIKKLKRNIIIQKSIMDPSDDSEKEKKQGATIEGSSTRQHMKRKLAEVSTSTNDIKVVKASVRTRKASLSSESSTVIEKPLEKRGRGRPRKLL